jgi:DNA-binding beta-propeller fold protein YncE
MPGMKKVISIIIFFLALVGMPAQEQSQSISKEFLIEQVIPVMPIYYHMFSGQLKEPKGIFYDRTRDEIYVADTGNDLVGVYNSEGVEMFCFEGSGHIEEPYYIMVDAIGLIYLIDIEFGKVKIFNYRGEFRNYFDFSSVPGPSVKPFSMTTDADGKLYFLDLSVPRILVFSADGRFLRSLGEKGYGRGKLSSPAGIAVDRSGKIYITDRTSIPVQVFDSKGEFLYGWGAHDIGAQNFSNPSGIAIDGKGRIFVVDTLRQDIKIFDHEFWWFRL